MGSDVFHIITKIGESMIVSGGFGGIAAFLYGIKKGFYKGKKEYIPKKEYIAKFLIEVSGAMITAIYLAPVVPLGKHKYIAAFMIGLGWSRIIQGIRLKFSKLVELIFGEIIEKDGK